MKGRQRQEWHDAITRQMYEQEGLPLPATAPRTTSAITCACHGETHAVERWAEIELIDDTAEAAYLVGRAEATPDRERLAAAVEIGVQRWIDFEGVHDGYENLVTFILAALAEGP